MESSEKANNDLEQYIVLDGITVCLEKIKDDMEKQEKVIKRLKTLAYAQMVIIAVIVIYLAIS